MTLFHLKNCLKCVTLKFLRYVVERKIGVILRRKLATHNEQMSKLSCVSLF